MVNFDTIICKEFDSDGIYLSELFLGGVDDLVHLLLEILLQDILSKLDAKSLCSAAPRPIPSTEIWGIMLSVFRLNMTLRSIIFMNGILETKFVVSSKERAQSMTWGHIKEGAQSGVCWLEALLLSWRCSSLRSS